MTRTFSALPFLLLLPFAAPAAPPQKFISDQITVTIRERPSNDGAPVGLVKSGARVLVQESLGPDSFTRIRAPDGREGWVPSRFVSGEPAARDQLDEVRAERDKANTQVRALEQQLQGAQDQLAKARPAFELSKDNERLRTEMADLKRDADAAQQRYDVERAKRSTMIAGGSLVGAGILLGLVLPFLGRGKKRRYGDF